MQQWITLDDAAGYIKIGRSTLYRLARSGKVPAHKIGRSWRFNLPELDDWLHSGREGVYSDSCSHFRQNNIDKRPIRIIDLFSGAGGLTLGFVRLSSRQAVSVWANDFNRYAAETYNANFGPHCVDGDILDHLADPKTVIPQADIVIGGPPCQGFSLLNKNRDGDLKPPVGIEIRDAEPPYDLHFGRTPTEMSLRRYKTIPEEGMN